MTTKEVAPHQSYGRGSRAMQLRFFWLALFGMVAAILGILVNGHFGTKDHNDRFTNSPLDYGTNVYSTPRQVTRALSGQDNQVCDWIVAGLGLSGNVAMLRLAQTGDVVCGFDAGRDEEHKPPILPVPSSAPVPQPGDYAWGQYIRGGLQSVPVAISRGFLDVQWWSKTTSDPTSKSISYPRVYTLGGCSNHNAQIFIREGPWGWQKWMDLGLTDWSYNNLVPYFKMVENRSQKNAGGGLYFDPAITAGLTNSFDAAHQGLNGMIPIESVDLSFVPFQGAYKASLYAAVTKTLNPTYNYSFGIDISHPSNTWGGFGSMTISAADQTGSIIPPGGSTYIPFAQYNQPRYGDNGFTWPPEFAQLNNAAWTGMPPGQRASSANTYLFAAKQYSTVQVTEEAWVTRVLLDTTGLKPKAIGVEYIPEGYNVLSLGRNPMVETAGYGGTAGDALNNARDAATKPRVRVFARKGVVLAMGSLGSPHVAMLSGIGNEPDLSALGINTVVSLPGVGQNAVDNQELFLFFQTNSSAPLPLVPIASALRSDPALNYPDFEVLFGLNGPGGLGGIESMEAADPFINQGWTCLKNQGALLNPYVRNNFTHLLQDPTVGNPATSFKPICLDPSQLLGILVEKESDNLSTGYVKLVSNDPTVAPQFVGNYLQDSAGADLTSFYNILYNQVFPVLLAQRADGYFYQPYNPSVQDILKDGFITFTNMNQIDPVKLHAWIPTNVGVITSWAP